MRAPVSAEDFARQVALPVERVEEHRAAGLLDPDEDDLFDDFDVLRATFLSLYESEGLGIDEILAEAEAPQGPRSCREASPNGTNGPRAASLL